MKCVGYLTEVPSPEDDLRPRSSMHSRKRDIEKSLVAEFIIPDWGDRVNSSIDTQTVGPVRQPYVVVDSIPQSGTMNLASGQATRFNIWAIWAMDRSSAQPQVNLSLLRGNSLKFQPQIPPCHGQRRKRRKRLSWNFKQSMGARNRVGVGLSYRPAGLHRLAEFFSWNRFLGSINV